MTKQRQRKHTLQFERYKPRIGVWFTKKEESKKIKKDRKQKHKKKEDY